jgi:hypothetical protein
MGNGTRPTERLSKNPAQVRNRIRRRAHDLDRDVAILYKKPIEEWDLEELARGKPRNKKGNFSGRPPVWITPLIVKEAKRRLMDETFGDLAGYAKLALDVLQKLMKSEEVDANGRPLVDAKTKLTASIFVLEHILGKPKAVIELEDPKENQRMALAAAIVLDDGQPQGHLTKVIEGDFTEEDDGELT